MEKENNSNIETNENEEHINEKQNITIQEAVANNERTIEEDIKLLKDQLLRAVAEGENIRKRAEKQVEETARFAITNFAKDLINVIENLERATETITSEVLSENPIVKTISEGVEMTKRELFSVFEKHNINKITPIRGDKFDHNIHQAVATIEDKEIESGNISSVMQSGYIIKDRLLRPAIVTVVK